MHIHELWCNYVHSVNNKLISPLSLTLRLSCTRAWNKAAPFIATNQRSFPTFMISVYMYTIHALSATLLQYSPRQALTGLQSSNPKIVEWHLHGLNTSIHALPHPQNTTVVVVAGSPFRNKLSRPHMHSTSYTGVSYKLIKQIKSTLHAFHTRHRRFR